MDNEKPSANNAKHLRRNFESFLGTVQEVAGEKIMPTMVEIWKAEGKTEGKAEAVLSFLRAKFHQIPKRMETTIRQITDPVALDSWITRAATCQSLEEFSTALK